MDDICTLAAEKKSTMKKRKTLRPFSCGGGGWQGGGGVVSCQHIKREISPALNRFPRPDIINFSPSGPD